MRIESLKISDFYYLFPAQLKKIKPWPTSLNEYKKAVRAIHEQYEDILNSKRLFYDLEKLQNNTISHLLYKGILDKDKYDVHVARLNINTIPDGLLNCLANDSFRQTDIYRLISQHLPLEPIDGASGLKYRSNLMEFRYDI